MSMESNSFSRERALEKIKKCLALAESPNPNEAESALRQARKLMEKYLNRPGFLRHFPGSVNVASQTLPVTAGC